MGLHSCGWCVSGAVFVLRLGLFIFGDCFPITVKLFSLSPSLVLSEISEYASGSVSSVSMGLSFWNADNAVLFFGIAPVGLFRLCCRGGVNLYGNHSVSRSLPVICFAICPSACFLWSHR